VRVGGELGGYGGGTEVKEFLLELEGAINKD
jgi:O6-methylguanine-DNA--protein-cysteine methyltransferase